MLKLMKYIIIFVAILIILLITIIIYLYFRKRKKVIARMIKLLEMDENLQKEIDIFLKKKTKLIFHFISFNKNQIYDKLELENKTYKIDNQEELKCDISVEETGIGNNISIMKNLKLSKGEQNKIFLIEIYLHQDNCYDILIDINTDLSFSIETIFFSHNYKLLPKEIKINEVKFNLKDFDSKNSKISNIINIKKKDFIEYIKNQGYINLYPSDPIFNNQNKNFFLNTRIIDENKRENSLFLNEIEKKIKELNTKDIQLLNEFFVLLLKPYIFPYSNYEYKKIPYSVIDSFNDKYDKFWTNISNQDNLNNNNSSLFLNNFFDNNFSQQLNEKIADNLEENKIKNIKISSSKDSYNLDQAKSMIKNFFNESFNARYSSQPSDYDIEIAEKICYLDICIHSKDKYEKLYLFQKFKNKFIKKVKKFNNKDKLKIIFTIYGHILDGNSIENLELIQIFDLPECSPYYQGEKMYRKIITSLTEKSKLLFIFLQLNSGAGYDYLKKINCYKIKIIPLKMIKYHLLKNNTNYFFRYWNCNDNQMGCIDSYTHIESINEVLAFGQKNIINKELAYEENIDNSIKFCLLLFHEKEGHEKYEGGGKMLSSPRYLFNYDLTLYDNLDSQNNQGESGNAIEYFLYGKISFYDNLLRCRNLQKLSNINLFIEQDNKSLIETIENIFQENRIEYGNTINIKYNENRLNKRTEKILDEYKLSQMTYYDLGIHKLK